MTSPIEIGSTVFLKSGSPPLRVVAWTDEGIHVAWDHGEAIFPPACLIRDPK